MILITYQKCWESGEVLAHWKLASITTFYREDVREHPGENSACIQSSVMLDADFIPYTQCFIVLLVVQSLI